MSKFSFLLIFIFCSFFSNAQDLNWEWGGPLDPAQSAFDVKHITLDLEADPDARTIKGTAELKLEIVSAIDHIKLDLIDHYQVNAVEINGKKAHFEREEDLLLISLNSTVKSGEQIDVLVNYGGVTPEAVNPPWQGGFTYAKDANGKHWVGLSSQNEGGKIFMPAKDHPSDEPDNGVDLIITVPSSYKVAANGLLISEKTENNKATYHWQTNYSINNYGINFTIGDFVTQTKNYTTIEGNQVPMVMYLLRQNENRLTELMDILELSMRTQEKYFGEYPFVKEKVGIVETPYLGMEHQTINAYGNNYNYKTVGDTTYDTLLYHELGHEWWGNKVGVSDWADFWIHEGFCAYGDWLFYEEHGGREAYLQHVNNVGKYITNEIPIIIKENATSDEAYHSEIYTKGAFVLHSLRYILGDEVFFKTIRDFAHEPAFTYENQVKTRDLQFYITEKTDYDVKPFFDLFLRTTEVPGIIVKEINSNSFSIEIPNIDFTLPMDVKLEDGTQRLELSAKPVTVTSSVKPIVDAEGWFLKDVVYE